MPGFPEIVHEGWMTAYIHKTDSGDYVVADQAGWLPGTFPDRDAALASARKANGLTL